jgi:nucleotide-binding universal stress UspA family protein
MQILLPVDGSKFGISAVKWILDNLDHARLGIGQPLNSSGAVSPRNFKGVIVVNVVETVDSASGSMQLSKDLMQEIQSRLTTEAVATVQEVMNLLTKAGVPCKHYIGHGRAPQLIADSAKSFGVDMVVMGQRGMSAKQRTMLGSVSEYVVRNAPCTVVVIKSEGQ